MLATYSDCLCRTVEKINQGALAGCDPATQNSVHGRELYLDITRFPSPTFRQAPWAQAWSITRDVA
jgi:hypothetical protein